MISFKVAPDGRDTYEVTASSRDIVQWERVTKGGTFQGLMEALSLNHMTRIAYFASKRQGMWDGTEREFEDGCDITPIETEESAEPNPTNPGQ